MLISCFVRPIKKQLLLTAFFIVTFTSIVCGQKSYPVIDISLNVGYATFSQKSLKEFQKEKLAAMPVPGKILSSFPGYLNFFADFSYFDSTYYIGMKFGKTSTGGRIQYTDYSGSITYDQLVSMPYLGVFYAKSIVKTKFGTFFIGADLLLYRNSVEFDYTMEIQEQLWATQIQLESDNLTIGPYMQLFKCFGPFFFKTSLGYELHWAQELYLKNSGQKFITSTGESLRVDANGLRINIGLGYKPHF